MTTTEDILGAIANALKAGDMPAVVDLMKYLAVHDPHRASELMDIIRDLPVDSP